MTTPSSEARYRRLLALYPRDFRREYEEEMLAVLLADPRPGQAFDIVRGAVTAHLRAAWAGHARAARVVQILGAMLLFAVALRWAAVALSAWIRHGNADLLLELPNEVRLLGWGLALLAALRGWRVIGAAGALAGLAGQIAWPAQFYEDTPATVLHAYWLIVAAAVVLIAGLVAEPGAVARPRGLVAVALAGVFLVLHGQINYSAELWAYRVVLIMLAVTLVAVALIRQEPEIRSRLVCWAAPVIVTVPLIQWGFGGFIEYNMRHPESTRMINPMQWILLVLIPFASFVVAAGVRETRPGRRRFRGDAGRTSKEA